MVKFKETLKSKLKGIENSNDYFKQLGESKIGNHTLEENFSNYIDMLGRNKGKLIGAGTAAYEGLTGKLIYDSNAVLSNPTVQAEVSRGLLPNGPKTYASLFWPVIREAIKNSGQTPTFTKSMTAADHAVKFFHDHPSLEVIAIILPLAGVTYYGAKEYCKRKKWDIKIFLN